MIEEVIEAILRPEVLSNLLCPLAAPRLTLHSPGPGHSPPDHNHNLVLVLALRLLTVFASPVPASFISLDLLNQDNECLVVYQTFIIYLTKTTYTPLILGSKLN